MTKLAESIGLVTFGVTVVVLAWAAPSLASANVVPEPGSLVLVSTGIAAVALGARWFRRK